MTADIPKDQYEYTDEETERRAEAVLRQMLNTPPKPRTKKPSPAKDNGNVSNVIATNGVFAGASKVARFYQIDVLTQVEIPPEEQCLRVGYLLLSGP